MNIDKKEENGEGEFAAMTRAAGSEPVQLWPGSEGSTINLMDPILVGGQEDVGGQYSILRATTELLNDGHPLSPFEGKALRVARQAALRAAEGRGRVPVLEDVLKELGNVDDDAFSFLRGTARDQMHSAGATVRFMLERLPEEFPGLFDGETSEDVQLGQKVTTFDIHRLPDGPAVSIAMMLVQTWLIGMLRREDRLPTQMNIPEGWHLVGGPTGKVVRSNSKLQRGLGLAMCVDFHHPSDFPSDDPAIAFLREAQTIHLFRQSREDDAMACERIFGLRPGTGRALMTLETGTRYIKIGTRPEILVDNVRSEIEVKLTTTDSALTRGEGRG
ncbi:hypothetical protein [Agromyces sp. Soil535]|uniref:hypothetical protein n=1 Tax=Agromyces sp. Soil535 TaxID=1736390 RepID=UPI00138F0D1D|nr:hypothetical protein [Agromyces sp. Soil535]